MMSLKPGMGRVWRLSSNESSFVCESRFVALHVLVILHNRFLVFKDSLVKAGVACDSIGPEEEQIPIDKKKARDSPLDYVSLR